MYFLTIYFPRQLKYNSKSICIIQTKFILSQCAVLLHSYYELRGIIDLKAGVLAAGHIVRPIALRTNWIKHFSCGTFHRFRNTKMTAVIDSAVVRIGKKLTLRRAGNW